MSQVFVRSGLPQSGLLNSRFYQPLDWYFSDVLDDKFQPILSQVYPRTGMAPTGVTENGNGDKRCLRTEMEKRGVSKNGNGTNRCIKAQVQNCQERQVWLIQRFRCKDGYKKYRQIMVRCNYINWPLIQYKTTLYF